MVFRSDVCGFPALHINKVIHLLTLFWKLSCNWSASSTLVRNVMLNSVTSFWSPTGIWLAIEGKAIIGRNKQRAHMQIVTKVIHKHIEHRSWVSVFLMTSNHITEQILQVFDKRDRSLAFNSQLTRYNQWEVTCSLNFFLSWFRGLILLEIKAEFVSYFLVALISSSVIFTELSNSSIALTNL